MPVIMGRPRNPKRRVGVWEKKLRALRDNRGLTRLQAAGMVGVSLRTWISWENSQYVPSRFVQIHLKKVFPELD